MNKEQIQFNKTLSQRRKESIVKACIWGGDGKSGCSNTIISAHSIQRGKILVNISDLGKVYYLGLEPKEDMSGLTPVFRPEGIKKFSTFNGFCGEHDKSIFQPIEDRNFVGSDEQKNIYAYRAMAKELHTNTESSLLVKNLLGDKLNEDNLPHHLRMTLPDILAGNLIVPPFIQEMMIENSTNDILRNRFKILELNISELKLKCNHLKSVLDDKVSTRLDHLYFSLDKEYPIACSSDFIPYFGYDGSQIISTADALKSARTAAVDIESIKSVTLSIFPEGGRTHILFTCSKQNTQFKSNIENLFCTSDENIKKGMSDIIINYTENVAFNPSYIEDKFDESERESITKAYARNIIETHTFSQIDINLFRD